MAQSATAFALAFLALQVGQLILLVRIARASAETLGPRIARALVILPGIALLLRGVMWIPLPLPVATYAVVIQIERGISNFVGVGALVVFLLCAVRIGRALKASGIVPLAVFIGCTEFLLTMLDPLEWVFPHLSWTVVGEAHRYGAYANHVGIALLCALTAYSLRDESPPSRYKAANEVARGS
jgi:hypothetical protein